MKRMEENERNCRGESTAKYAEKGEQEGRLMEWQQPETERQGETSSERR